MQYNEIEVGDEVLWVNKNKGDTRWRVQEGLRDPIYKVVRKYADLGRESIITIADGDDEFEVYITELF